MLTWLVNPVPTRRLGWARLVIGTAAALRALVALPVLLRLSDPEVVKAPNFAWMPQPSVVIAFVLVALWLVSAVLFATGWMNQVWGYVLFACLVFMLALDLQTYSNHLYLMALLVLFATLAGSAPGFKFGTADVSVPRWPILLMCLQVSIVYFFAAVTKINDAFLSGATLAGVLNGGVLTLPDALRTPAFMSSLALVAIVTELSLALGFWISRFRMPLWFVGAGFHLSMVALMADTAEIAVFAMLMFAVYPLYDVVHPRPAESSTEY